MAHTDLTVKELRSLATELGIRNRSGMRKQALIEAIAAAQAVHKEAITPTGVSSTAASSTVSQQPAAPFGPHGDPGLPIPERYDTDRLVLMVQDPHHLHVYWELRPDTLRDLRARCGRQAAGVLIIHSAGTSEQRVIDLASHNYYITLAPDRDCRVELALRDDHGALFVFLSSNTVRTPAHRVSPHGDASWMDVHDSLAVLLDQAALGSGLSSAELGRRLESVVWDIPHLPSSGELASSGALSSGAWLSSGALHHRHDQG